VIFTTAVFITLLQLSNLYVYARLDIIPLPEGFSFDVPLSTVLALVLLYLPLAVFVTGALIIVSALAKSYKEAQLYFFPLYLAGMLPALAGALGQISLRSAIVVIPIANSSVAAREVLSGHADWTFLLVSVVVNMAAALALMRYATGLLSNENLITDRQEPALARLSGAPAYRSQVWRWWMAIWAVFVGASLALPEVQTQLLVNEVVIFLGLSLFLIRWYHLDPRRALALEPIRWRLWVVVVLMIGPLHMTGVLIGVLGNTIIPFPTEQFAEQMAVLDEWPAWQIVLLIAVLPGVSEEVAFRGLLLYGLRGRYSLPGLAVVVGLVFGFFHFDMLRIVTTGTLGIVISAVAIMTGSIFPGIVLHVGNNALAVWLGAVEVPVDRADPGIFVFSVLAVLGLLWVVSRNRTVYPGD
jgi:sodium transport system permease protein